MRHRTARLFAPWLAVMSLACGDHSGESGAAGDSPAPIRRPAAQAPAQKLSPRLRRILDSGAPNQRLRVLVDLSAQVDYAELARLVEARGLGKRARRRLAVTALRRVATEYQRELHPVLDRLKRRGAVDDYWGFSVVNRMVVVASPAAVRTLAERAEVAAIVEETEEDISVPSAGAQTGARRESVSWAISAIGADSAWKLGLDGRGAVIGLIDAGASASHEQLRAGFRGGDDGWYDPEGGTASPHDVPPGHGTSVLSSAVGRNPTGRVIGVAPRAEWVACLGLPRGRYNNVLVTQCADWMLNAAQPDVVINAWLLSGHGCDRSLEPIVNAWRAAEMVVVFPAGNEGPAPGTGGSPANYVGLYPGGRAALSVGGHARDGSAYAKSSRGPGACDGSIYPTVAAPGEDVPTAFPLTPSTYLQAKGTSVAAGVAAGAAALMVQRFPEIPAAEIEEALRASARDIGPAGPDNTFGGGRLYVPGAIDWLARRGASSASARIVAVAARQR